MNNNNLLIKPKPHPYSSILSTIIQKSHHNNNTQHIYPIHHNYKLSLSHYTGLPLHQVKKGLQWLLKHKYLSISRYGGNRTYGVYVIPDIIVDVYRGAPGALEEYYGYVHNAVDKLALEDT